MADPDAGRCRFGAGHTRYRDADVPARDRGPTSNLVFSVDNGATWSANVNAAPGQTVIAREYYDNDTSANITGASVTTSLPSGFSLVAGSTEVCLNPGTTDPTNPTSELACNTQTGGAAPNDEGGPIDESSVWSGSNLSISPTAGRSDSRPMARVASWPRARSSTSTWKSAPTRTRQPSTSTRWIHPTVAVL